VGREASGGVGQEVFGAGREHKVADLTGQDRRVLHVADDYSSRDALGECATGVKVLRLPVAVSIVHTIPHAAIVRLHTHG
jgi:hypothetical protein